MCFFNKNNEPLPLHDKYKGGSVFMIGGGRSITPRHLELLKQPGIVTASLNEASHFIRPDIFYCSDLHEIPYSILEDPKIDKYVPTYVSIKQIFEDYGKNKKTIGDYPNVVSCAVQTKTFNKESYTDPRYLFRQRGPGEKYTPFSAIILINLLVKLGFKNIYLLGYDFSDETNPCTYFYPRTHVRGTGRGIAKIRDTMEQLTEIEDVVKIYNCSPRSGLKFFEYKDFETAINENKIKVEPDIFERSTKERFNWYIKTRTIAGGNTVFLKDKSKSRPGGGIPRDKKEEFERRAAKAKDIKEKRKKRKR